MDKATVQYWQTIVLLITWGVAGVLLALAAWQMTLANRESQDKGKKK